MLTAYFFVQIHFRQIPAVFQNENVRVVFFADGDAFRRLIRQTHLIFLFRARNFNPQRQIAELMLADHGITGRGTYQAARDLLLKEAPRLNGSPIRTPDEPTLAAARRLALRLDGGVLPIQGPPGSGKTYTAARMIADLLVRVYELHEHMIATT